MFNQGADISSGRTDSLTYSGDSGSNSAANPGDDVLNHAFIEDDADTIFGVHMVYFADILDQLVHVTNGVLHQDLSSIGSFGSTTMASILLESNGSNGSNPTDNESISTFGGGRKNNPAYNELVADIKKVTKALSNMKLVIKSKRDQSLNHSRKRTCKRKINRQPSHVSPKNLRKSKRKRKINRKIKM